MFVHERPVPIGKPTETIEILDIVEFDEDGRGGAKTPIVPYERIEMHIDYPLVDNNTDAYAAASAD